LDVCIVSFSLAQIVLTQWLVEFASSPIIPGHKEFPLHIDDQLCPLLAGP
jgi:hypothetical protein